jgi:hypothetical protein
MVNVWINKIILTSFQVVKSVIEKVSMVADRECLGGWGMGPLSEEETFGLRPGK